MLATDADVHRIKRRQHCSLCPAIAPPINKVCVDRLVGGSVGRAQRL